MDFKFFFILVERSVSWLCLFLAVLCRVICLFRFFFFFVCFVFFFQCFVESLVFFSFSFSLSATCCLFLVSASYLCCLHHMPCGSCVGHLYLCLCEKIIIVVGEIYRRRDRAFGFFYFFQ